MYSVLILLNLKPWDSRVYLHNSNFVIQKKYIGLLAAFIVELGCWVICNRGRVTRGSVEFDILWVPFIFCENLRQVSLIYPIMYESYLFLSKLLGFNILRSWFPCIQTRINHAFTLYILIRDHSFSVLGIGFSFLKFWFSILYYIMQLLKGKHQMVRFYYTHYISQI